MVATSLATATYGSKISKKKKTTEIKLKSTQVSFLFHQRCFVFSILFHKPSMLLKQFFLVVLSAVVIIVSLNYLDSLSCVEKHLDFFYISFFALNALLFVMGEWMDSGWNPVGKRKRKLEYNHFLLLSFK